MDNLYNTTPIREMGKNVRGNARLLQDDVFGAETTICKRICVYDECIYVYFRIFDAHSNVLYVCSNRLYGPSPGLSAGG